MIDKTGEFAGESQKVARAAALISVGNIVSRALGLARDMAKSYFFGAGGAVSAFDVAALVPTMFYDQFVGGLLNSALVPVFSDYARDESHAELWRVLSFVLSFLTLILGALVVFVEVAAPWIAQILGKGLEPPYADLATAMIRITAPAVFFLNIAGLVSGVLYALQRFTLPAFTAAVFNATVVLVILVGHKTLDAHALAVGWLCASVVQVLFQWPGLRGARVRLKSPFPLHPALIKIGQLYLPIGLGLLVDQAAVALSFNIASRTGPSGIAWMKYAATLIQFPLGLTVTAISIAILPTLSRYAADANEEAFRAALAQGLRLVLILVIPAAMALLVMGEPVVALIYQRGEFLPADTAATTEALRFSILGLIFAALDQPLVYAFYARKDTWTPALVGMGTNLLYVVLAVVPTLFGPPQLWALILANSFKLAVHALWMLHLFTRKVGSLRPHRIERDAAAAFGASLMMAIPMVIALLGLEQHVPAGALGYLIRICAAGTAGLGSYFFLLWLMDTEKLSLLRQALRRPSNGDQ